jgi:hypothetical protein
VVTAHPNPWAQDALWAGPRIVQRLRTEVSALREVLLIDEVDPDANELMAQLPGALVYLAEMAPAGANEQRSQATVEQVWGVVLVARQARRTPPQHMPMFGPLISQVVKALQGWRPDDIRPLSWQRTGRPRYGKDRSFFPLAFGLRVVSTN